MKTTITILALMLFAFASISQERNPITVKYKGDRPGIVDFALAYFNSVEDVDAVDLINNDGKPTKVYPESYDYPEPGLTVDKVNGYLFYRAASPGEHTHSTEITYWNCTDNQHKIIGLINQSWGCCRAPLTNVVEFYRYNNQTRIMTPIEPPYDRQLTLADYYLLDKFTKEEQEKLYAEDGSIEYAYFDLPSKGTDIMSHIDSECFYSEEYPREKIEKNLRDSPVLKWNGNGFTVIRQNTLYHKTNSTEQQSDSSVDASKNINSTAERFKAEYVNQNPRNEAIGVAYIVDPDPKGTNVRESPGGKVIKVLQRDANWMIDLCEAWNGWFRISPEIDSAEDDAIDLKTDNCWVHGSLVASSTRNYDNQTLKFYAKPDSKSAVTFTVSDEVQVTFVDVTNEWAKVCYTDKNGKKLIGWIELEWLCGNPYTTCS